MWSTEEKLNVNNIIYNSSTNYNLRVGDKWLLCPISKKNSVLGSIPAAEWNVLLQFLVLC